MKKTAQGFTLVELLVVIAIIAILMVVVGLILNPPEILRQGRDSARLTDLSSMQQAINLTAQESTNSSNIFCNGAAYPCTGKSTDAAPSARNSDGTGWVKVNLNSQKTISMPTLPADKTNNAAFHYVYCADNDTWEIDTVLESDKQKGLMLTDGGDDDNKYEVGSSLKLVGVSAGCSY